MGEDMTRDVLTGLVTLVVGFTLFQLQEGGRRRRLRREIREELELMALLGDESPVRKRLHARVDRLLRRYEPAKRRGSNLGWMDWAALMSILLAGAGLVLTLLPDLEMWQGLAVGGAVGAVGAVAATVLETRRERKLDHLKLHGAD